MQKFLRVAALGAVLLMLPGCTTAVEALKYAYDAYTEIVDSLVKTREGLQRACDKIPAIEANVIEAALRAGINPNSCKAKNAVVRERKAAEAVCANLHKLGDRIPLNYYTSVRAGLLRARAAVAAGC